MAKHADSLSGITFENKILAEVLKEREEKRRTSAIEQERRREENRGARFSGIPWGRTVKTTYHGRSGKAKIWDDHKIRREYGLEKKKFGSQWENCLWLIAFESPITGNTISKKTGETIGGITGALSYIHNCLGEKNRYGPPMIKRQRDFLRAPYKYSPIEKLETDEDRTTWFEKARENYPEAHRVMIKDQKADRKPRRTATRAIEIEANDPHAETVTETPAITTLPGTEEKLELGIIETPQIQEHETSEPAEPEAETKIKNRREAAQKEQARQLEELIGQFVVEKLQSMNMLKTTEVKLTVAGGVDIRINFSFGK